MRNEPAASYSPVVAESRSGAAVGQSGDALVSFAPRNQEAAEARKLRQGALKALKSLARINLCEDGLALYPSHQNRSARGEFPFSWLTKSFESMLTHWPGALTCVSFFHIMNKPRTFCGEVQAGLLGDNAAHAEGQINLRLATAKRSGRC
jgi:hypothetical protein